MASLLRRILRFFKEAKPQKKLLDLTDDILEEIFLRIDSPTDLARASTTCFTFHCLITDRCFLRRYRSLHTPILLGFLYDGGRRFEPTEAPHPGARAGRALARAAHFSFNRYLPTGSSEPWVPCDVRDGRVLFMRCPENRDIRFPDLAVCDPLSQRCVLLPPICCDLVSSVEEIRKRYVIEFKATLVPSGDGEEDKSFRVIGRTLYMTTLAVFVFSSTSGCWRVGTHTRLSDPTIFESGVPLLHWSQYACGGFYWKETYQPSKLLKLDMNKMEFSTVDIPEHKMLHTVILAAKEGRTALFSHNVHDSYMDYYTMMQSESDTDNKWIWKDTIPLPDNYRCFIACAAEGYVFLIEFQKMQRMLCVYHLILRLLISRGLVA